MEGGVLLVPTVVCNGDGRVGGRGGCSDHSNNDSNDDDISRNSSNINQRPGIDKEHMHYTLRTGSYVTLLYCDSCSVCVCVCVCVCV
jgi:hypothetical protein